MPARDRAHAPDPRAHGAPQARPSSAIRCYGGSLKTLKGRPTNSHRRCAATSAQALQPRCWNSVHPATGEPVRLHRARTADMRLLRALRGTQPRTRRARAGERSGRRLLGPRRRGVRALATTRSGRAFAAAVRCVPTSACATATTSPAVAENRRRLQSGAAIALARRAGCGRCTALMQSALPLPFAAVKGRAGEVGCSIDGTYPPSLPLSAKGRRQWRTRSRRRSDFDAGRRPRHPQRGLPAGGVRRARRRRNRGRACGLMRGSAAGVLEATVATMRTPPEEILAWLGPAAGPLAQRNRRGGVRRLRRARCARSATFAATRPGHWNVDLYALAETAPRRRRRDRRARRRPVHDLRSGPLLLASPQHVRWKRAHRAHGDAWCGGE